MTRLSECEVLSAVNQLINSLEQSPSSEANSCSDSQEIPHIVQKPMLHLLLVQELLNQMDPPQFGFKIGFIGLL
jgi:hypothetical protein